MAACDKQDDEEHRHDERDDPEHLHPDRHALLGHVSLGGCGGKTLDESGCPEPDRRTSAHNERQDVCGNAGSAGVAADGHHRRVFSVLACRLTDAGRPNLLHRLNVAPEVLRPLSNCLFRYGRLSLVRWLRDRSQVRILGFRLQLPVWSARAQSKAGLPSAATSASSALKVSWSARKGSFATSALPSRALPLPQRPALSYAASGTARARPRSRRADSDPHPR